MFLNVSKHTSDCINFIKENNTSFLISGHFKQFSYHSGALQSNKKERINENPWERINQNHLHLSNFVELHVYVGIMISLTFIVCYFEQLTDTLRVSYLANIFLHQFRSNHTNEAGICSICHRTGTECFSSPRRSKQQDSFRRLDTKVHKTLGLKHRDQDFAWQRTCIAFTVLSFLHMYVL